MIDKNCNNETVVSTDKQVDLNTQDNINESRFATSGSTPHTSNELAIPVKHVGSNEMYLGKPDTWLNVSVNGVYYTIPGYISPGKF